MESEELKTKFQSSPVSMIQAQYSAMMDNVLEVFNYERVCQWHLLS